MLPSSWLAPFPGSRPPDRGAPLAKNAAKDKTSAKQIAESARAENLDSSTSRPDVAHFDDLGVANSQLTGRLDVLRQGSDRREPRPGPPFLDLANSQSIDRDRIFAREDRGVMHGIVRLRLRTARILRHQSIHDVEDDLRPHDRHLVNLRDRGVPP